MSEDQSIIQRLEALERQNRRIKGVGAAVIAIAASLLLMGQARPPRRIEANQFVLVDSNGKARSMWTVESGGLNAGRAALDFYDDRGIIEGAIASSSGGASLMLSGKSGTSIYFPNSIGMTSRDNNAKLDLSVSDAASIKLTRDHNVIWKAP
jgi:hypothetical protein